MDNDLLKLIIVLLIGKSKKDELTIIKSVSNFISTMEINQKYTLEKIRIIKKIGPYLPEDYIPLINKSILLTEGIIKINELNILINNNDDYSYIKDPITISSNKDRVSKIINILQKEVPKSEIKDLGFIMDIIINMDNYKKMLNILSSVTNNQDATNDPTQLMNIFTSLMNSNGEKDNDKLKEMTKIMEIIKTLNTSKTQTPKEKSKDNKNIEIIEKPSKE